jgi:CHAT domain-containing protein
MRALVVIASPKQLERWKPEGRSFAEARLVRARPTPDGPNPGARPLAALDPSEVTRAREALLNTQIDWLVSRSLAPADLRCEAPTLDNLILYLVCHGALVRVTRGDEVCDEPRLWLEDENGDVNIVSGIELTARIRELMRPPRLVVLASCQSAGTGDDASSSDGGALAALGPQLARAGVPAVIAMQGNVKMRTVAQFLPRFFQVLRDSGQLDRAVARARSELVHRQFPDSYMPVLFMRLRNGQLWHQPSRKEEDFNWDPLLQALRRGKCVVILGSGLLEQVLGSNRLLAKRWAETHRFPMAEHHCEDLAQVAQYLAVIQYELFPRYELENYMRQHLLDRFGPELSGGDNLVPLDQLSLDELMIKVVNRTSQTCTSCWPDCPAPCFWSPVRIA